MRVEDLIPRHLIIALSILLAAALGLSVYALHMRKSASAPPVAAIDTRPLAPPITGPSERVVLFIAHARPSGLTNTKICSFPRVPR